MKRLELAKTVLPFLILFPGWFSCLSCYGQEATVQDLIDKALVLEGQNDYQGALPHYDKALRVVDQEKDQDMTAFLLRKKGTCFIFTNQYDSAFHYLNLSKQLAEVTQNLEVLAYAENSIAFIYRVRALLDSSRIHYLKAYQLFKAIRDTLGMAKVGHNLAEFYLKKGIYDSALYYALKTNKTFSQLEYSPNYLRSLICLGNVYERLKQNDSALSCYNIAFEISQELDNQVLLNTILINKGVINFYMEEFDESKTYLLEAMKYFEEVDDEVNLALIYSNLSAIYLNLDEPILSIHYGKKALAAVEKTGNTEQEISVYNNLGNAYKEIGEFNEAITYYSICRDMALEHDYLEELKKNYSNLSIVYTMQGKHEAALEYHFKYDSVAGVIMNLETMNRIEELNATYELIQLNDEIRINELQIKKTKLERNLIFGISAFIVSLLVWLALFYFMRLKKNRIISEQKIKQLEDEKKLLAAQSVIVGQEEERKRIARELHDGIGVMLSTAKIQFSSIEDDKADDRTNKIFKNAHQMLDKAGKEVRRISHDMMPGVLSKFGLREALEDLFEDVGNMSDLKIEVDMQCSQERLPDNMEIMLFRVVQELLNNTIKHAEATSVSCSIKRTKDSIEIVYADDGKGFDEKSLPHNKSLGIFGIRSRIDFLSGTVELESTKGKGTKFSIFVPLKQDIKRK